MKLFRSPKDLPVMAGGEPEPGERLAADAQYMDAGSAARVNELVAAWRRQPRDEFEESAGRL
jgi:hypothetical protein